MKIKENAINDFNELIKNSWTYNRMTKEEKLKWNEVLSNCFDINGSYDQRIHCLHKVYTAFLIGIGYTGWKWRE